MGDPEHSNPPAYGASSHYLGSRGEVYLAWQNQSAKTDGRINAKKFQRYIEMSDVVLDFGCGAGNLLSALSCDVRIGVEINPAARSLCRAKGIQVHEALHEVSMGSIDVCISNHALEHVWSPVEALRQLRTKLKPNGTLVICVPMEDWRRERKFDHRDINRHLYSWGCPSFR